MTRLEHNALIYAWNAGRQARGRCPYCRYGRLDTRDDGRQYSRCVTCRDRMALAHQLRKDRTHDRSTGTR